MTPVSNGQSVIIRTERGLTIAGTRITLYDVMDYLKAQYPPNFRIATNLVPASLALLGKRYIVLLIFSIGLWQEISLQHLL